MRSPTIIIVEDETVTAMELAEKLSAMKYAVLAKVDTGEEAVEKALKLQPDLIVMDIRLNGDLDGIETAQKIRETLDVPIVYLTAYGDEETLERAKLTEPFGYLIKPYSETELRTTLEISLYKHRQEKKLKRMAEALLTALDVLGGAVITCDDKGLITSINGVAEAMTGRNSADAVGKPLKEVVSLRDQVTGKEVDDPLSVMRLESGLVPASTNYELVRENCEPVRIVSSVIAVNDVKGKTSGVVMAFQDVNQLVTESRIWHSHAQNLQLAAVLYWSQGRLNRAESFFKSALEIFEANLGCDHPKVAKVLDGLAGVYERLGKKDAAEAAIQRANSIRYKTSFLR